jgi:hypothetical protein
MNERQPYEKHLADKLQNLPPPGEVEQSWEQMRTLLDKEMPRGGGMPGRRQWWLFGIAIGVLFMATWLSGRSYLDKEAVSSVAQTTNPASTANDKPAVPAGKSSSTVTAPQIAAVEGSAATDPASKSQPAASANDVPTGQLAQGTPDNRAAPAITEPVDNNSNRKNNINNNEPRADEAIITHKDNRTVKSKTEKEKKDDQSANSFRNRQGITKENKRGNKANNQPALQAPANSSDRINNYPRDASQLLTVGGSSARPAVIKQVQSSLVQPPFPYPDQPGPVLTPGTTIEKDYARKSARLPDPPPDKKPARKNLLRTRQAGTFVLGFTLPLAFPLGDQRAMGYNMWAGHNTVSDYLPSPHFQYHLSPKTFLQTEAQLASPQFISPTLLAYNTTPLGPTGGYYMSNAVYAQKLYYFNVPVSIHHSPFPGFYMGTGIQFSSLISGVAMTEQRKWSPGGINTLVSETYSRFKNDSLSQKMNNNEFRVMLDANYYFNSFTVGLRYNQALSNYISFRLAPGVPYSFNKNRALQFYLRYNLWEEKKKSGTKKNMLTLK